jgi:uncharacterized surface protein with fasciclin (FAS1) repeats
MARTVYLVALALVTLAAVASAEDIPVEAENLACKATSVQQAIVQALRGKKELSEFRRMVAAATDIGTTQTPKAATLTVFAPTNAALARAFPASALINLITSTAQCSSTGKCDHPYSAEDVALHTPEISTAKYPAHLDEHGQSFTPSIPYITIPYITIPYITIPYITIPYNVL